VRCCLLADLEQRGLYAPIFVDPATGEHSNLLGLKPSATARVAASALDGWRDDEELASSSRQPPAPPGETTQM